MFFIDVNGFHLLPTVYTKPMRLCIFCSTFIIKIFVIRPVCKTKKKEKQKGVATYRCTSLSRYNHNTMLNVQDYYGYNNVTLIDRNSKCPKQYTI